MPAEEILKKLRVKAGDRVAVVGAPASYEEVVAGIPGEVARSLDGQFDFIHYFVTDKATLERLAPELKAALKPGAILWVSYPKGKAIATDLNRDIVRETVAQARLNTVSQVAIDDVWSALRLKPV